MKRIRLPQAKTLLLASASVVSLMVAAPSAYAGPLSEHVLSGGATGPAPNPTSPIPGIPGVVTNAQQVSQAQAQTTANLAAAAARLQAALTSQANQRSQAQGASSNVGNGLVAAGGGNLAGLVPDSGLASNGVANPVLTWVGADTPTQTGANGQTTVTINQHEAQALLNWQSFNVGKQTTVNFVQKDATGASQSTWVALNKVNDPSAIPSQILGQINAPGSVYIINHNGVIFGGGSQVNVNSLIAASADLDPAQFLTGGIYSQYANGAYSPSFTNAGGAITVEAGANITTPAPSSVTAGGGFVMLLGSTVSNAGSIATPDGQTMLAAGDDFLIRPGFGNQGTVPSSYITDVGNSWSTTRGSEVAIQLNTPGSSLTGGAGSVSNTGLIEATTGDISLVGENVTQAGTMFSTTSTNTRGTIHLLSSTSDPFSSVKLAAGSTTLIEPDAGGATALDSQRDALIANSQTANTQRNVDTAIQSGGQFDDLSLLTDREDQSRIEINSGGSVEFQGNSLAMAQGGQIAASAINRVQADSNALLDVSGSIGTILPATANIVQVNIQGNELRDDSINRDSKALFNDNVYVNAQDLTLVPAGTDGYPTDRYYTDGGLLEVSGWLGNTSHTIGEWTAEGGTVTLETGSTTTPAGAIVVQPSANINISGGAVSYEAGHVPTTWLMGADGKLYNINTAPAGTLYTGLANSFQIDHSRWVVTDNYSTGLYGGAATYASGYVVGRDAGSLVLSSPTAIFEGQIDAGVVVGADQTAARPSTVTDSYTLPQNVVALPGSLALGEYGALGQTNYNGYVTDVSFGANVPQIADTLDPDDAIPTSRVGTAWFDANAIDSFNLGGIAIEVSPPAPGSSGTVQGTFSITAPLTLAPGGNLNVIASAVDVAANITTPGGSVAITSGGIQARSNATPEGTGSGLIVEPNVTISTQGLWTNEQADPSARASQAFINGGAISLSSDQNLTLSDGSFINASAGGYVTPAGTVAIGNGGNISLLADQYDFQLGAYAGNGASVSNLGAVLTLDGTLASYGAKGGTLTLQFPQGLLVSDQPLPYGTAIPAGTTTTVDFTLSQPLTIKAGQPLPFGYATDTQSASHNIVAAPGSTLTTNPSLYTGLTFAADWVSQAFPGFYYSVNGGPPQYANYQDTVPAGAVVTDPSGAFIFSGSVIPANVFPQGIITGSYQTAVVQTIPAGTIATSDITFAAGTRVPAGSTLAQAIQVEPMLTLSPGFFQQGFSAYNITNLGDIDIAPGTKLDVTEPVYQVGAQTRSMSTGSNPANVFSVVLPPLYLTNSADTAITQRQGASLSLTTSAISAVERSVVTYNGALAGAGPLPETLTEQQAGQSTLLKGWTVPDDAFYQQSGGVYVVASNSVLTLYAPGQTIPAGSTLYYSALEGSDTNPNATAIPIVYSFPPTFVSRSTSLFLGDGASITVDPKQSVTLSSPGQLTIDGNITAHAGSITVSNSSPVQYDQNAVPGGATGLNVDPLDVDSNGLSIWIGSDSVLDVSGQAVTGTDAAGQSFGSVTAGGTINLGNSTGTPAFIILRPGAVLDADGASATLALFPASGPNVVDSTAPNSDRQTVASAGGTINITTYNGIYDDGVITAKAGGAGAADGTLSVRVANPVYDNSRGSVPLTENAFRYLTIGQTTEASGLPADLQPGLNDPALMVGQTYLSVEQIADGGFGNVTLSSDNAIVFAGNVDLSARQSLTLVGGYSDTQAGTTVRVAAPYLAFNTILGPSLFSGITNPTGDTPMPTPQDAVFEADATGLMDIENGASFAGFDKVSLVSAGDIRLIANRAANNYSGSLETTGDLSLTAQRIYALGGQEVGYQSGGIEIFAPKFTIDVTGDLSIHNADATTDTTIPDTAFGTLILNAATIEQGGALFEPMGNITMQADTVDLKPGSLTSTSSAGLFLPWGGTSDGINYTINGYAFLPGIDLNAPDGSLLYSYPTQGVTINNGNGSSNFTMNVEKGAVVDVSGGGDFQGKSFVSGEQGSVDTLLYPFLTFNGSGGYNANSSNQVFAIVAGAQPGYAAPIANQTIDGTNDPTPGIGAQITIPAGVPGLPAGTYTLLPSNYALLPGGYRVELQGNAQSLSTKSAVLPNGSYLVDAYQGIANTGIESTAPTQVTITPGKTVLDYSQYNQTTYSQSAATYIQTFGPQTSPNGPEAPWIPADAGTLNVNITDAGLGTPGTFGFSFQGQGIFTAGASGTPGQAIIGFEGGSSDIIEFVGAAGAQDAPPDTNVLVLRDSDLEQMGAPSLTITGMGAYRFGSIPGTPITVESGASLTGGTITLQTFDAPITIASGGAVMATDTLALLSINTGDPSLPPGSVDLEAGSIVSSQGELVISTPNLSIDPAAHVGAVSLNLAASQINIGTAASLQAAANAGQLPVGLSFTQDELNTLLNGNAAYGLPAMQSIELEASGALNLIGSTTLDATGLKTFEIDTPAIYGLGGSGDVASILANTLVWDTVFTINAAPVAATPAAITANGSGTGTGALNLTANTVVMGSATPGVADWPAGYYGGAGQFLNNVEDPGLGAQELQVAVTRVTSGFATVNVTGADGITSNGHGSLSVSQADGSAADLNMVTPLLTGTPGSVATYSATGTLAVAPPTGGSGNPVPASSLGAEIDLTGHSVDINSAIVANSGIVHVNATGDIGLGGSGRIDLSGVATPMNDVVEYSWGGDLDLESAGGNITQATGAVIDVSAVDNVAGSITARAIGNGAGQVKLGGALLGGSTLTPGVTAIYASGTAIVDAQTLNADASTLDGDFAALNASLDTGGFYGSRQFDLKQGNLTIGGTVKASDVEVSLDGGALTVGGLIDASGPAPGTIRLSAAGDLTLAPSGILDAHGSVLQVDGYGNPIDAENRATVELTTVNGTLTLASGTTIDVSSPDPNPQGLVILNAPRLGGTGTSATSGATITDANDGSLTTGANVPANAQGDDIAIQAGNGLVIKGAQSIALNAFATYANAPADPNDANGQVIDQGYLDLIDQDSQAFVSNAYGGNVSGGVLTQNLQNRLSGLLSYGAVFHLRPGVEIDSATPTGDLTILGDIDLSGYRYGPNADRNIASATYGAGEPGDLILRAGGNLNVEGNVSDGFYPSHLTIVPGSPVQYSAIDLTTSPDFQIYPSSSSLLGDGIASYYDSNGDELVFTANWTIPNDQFYNDLGGVYSQGYTAYYSPGQVIPAGTIVDAGNIAFEVGASLPSLGIETSPPIPTTASGIPTAAAPMLAAGELSWSMRFVAGADTTAADSRILRPMTALNGAGDLVLNNPNETFGGITVADPYGDPPVMDPTSFSVLRTGTGSLDLLAGGNFSELTDFGVYTAGTQSPTVGTDVANPVAGVVNTVTGAVQPDYVNEFDLARGLAGDGSGSVLGDWYNGSGNTYPYLTSTQAAQYEEALASYQAYYPRSGGDLLLHAQGNISAQPVAGQDEFPFANPNKDMVTNWLWQQGGSAGGEATAWWINFGTFANIPPYGPVGAGPTLVGFEGIGTLGGGNATISAGGNIENVQAAVGSTGRVTSVTQSGTTITGGTIDETGGGRLTINAGGDVGATLISTRGSMSVVAGTIGSDVQGDGDTVITPYVYAGVPQGTELVQGDAAATLNSRGDLLLSGVQDAGTIPTRSNFTNADFTAGSLAGQSGSATSWFSLYTDATADTLYSAGGALLIGIGNRKDNIFPVNVASADGTYPASMLPSTLIAVAATGSIYLDAGNAYPTGILELEPSSDGELELLAEDSIFGGTGAGGYKGASTQPGAGSDPSQTGAIIGISGADDDSNDLANPFRAGIELQSDVQQNLNQGVYGDYSPWTYEADIPTSALHAQDDNPVRIYAVTGNIDALGINDMAKSANIEAGGYIRYMGGQLTNADPNDVSLILAGGEILDPSIGIAGPGQLVVDAGEKIFMGSSATQISVLPIFGIDTGQSTITSTGLWFGQNGSVSGGAGVTVLAATGAGGPDYALFAALYLDPANQADAALPLDFPQNAGKVVQTYQDQLYAWLQANYHYSGSEANQMAYFGALSAQQQDVFLRQAFFNELDQSDMAFNDPANALFKSYIRGRTAIAALFPTEAASGTSNSSGGDITMLGGSGIRSEFGGDVDVFTPDGATTIGVEGPTPPSTAGVITQGSGNVNIYSLGSVELGQSRVFTTFGGAITIWSADGDIAAGKGAKTTVVYSPPLIAYDNYGNITLSPTVPTQGAGIATLAPIPQIPRGDVFLVAPEGVIDAGEAGIRVSGNAYLAALQVLNAANIQVKGQAFGLPPQPVTNLNFTAASTASTEAAQIARSLASQRQSTISVEVTGFGGDVGDPDECVPNSIRPCK